MRVAVVHSFYGRSQPSGENRVVEDQVAELARAGHEVHLIGRETDELAGGLYPLRTAWNVATRTGYDPTDRLRALRPDIVHLHNLFPNFSSRWVWSWRGPVVHSVHNYRALCSNGLLFRGDAICLECPTSGASKAVIHGCYRGSRLATAPVAVSRSGYRHDVLERVDALVATSEVSGDVLQRYVDRTLPIHLIPNFGAGDEAESGSPDEPAVWLAMGRLSPEKGFEQLVRDWPSTERLQIIGDGPQRDSLQSLVATSGKAISLSSSLPIEDLRRVIGRSFALVFPSRWLEVDPQVVVESMRQGLPVVSYAVNAAARVVEQSGAGSTYTNADSLGHALARVRDNRAAMSRAATVEYEARWSRHVWRTRMDALYREVVERHRGGPR